MREASHTRTGEFTPKRGFSNRIPLKTVFYQIFRPLINKEKCENVPQKWPNLRFERWFVKVSKMWEYVIDLK